MNGRVNIGHVRADKPPSAHAMGVLQNLLNGPMPSQEANFTVRDKLYQWGYVKVLSHASPYKTHKPGHMIPHLFITQEGRDALLAYRKV